MDIDKATQILTNEEQLKNFTDQVQGLNIQSSTNLTEFFIKITQNPLEWLRSLPEHNKSDNALRRYKTPLNTLLKDTQVKEALGKEFCDTTIKHIQKGYKEHIDEILTQRNKTMCLSIDTHSDTSSYTEHNTITDDDHSETSTEPEDNSSIPEPVYEDPKLKKESIDDYTKKLQYLETQLQDALIENKILKTSLHHITRENNRLWEHLDKITSK
jgi:hypothetical protein